MTTILFIVAFSVLSSFFAVFQMMWVKIYRLSQNDPTF